MSKTPRVGLSLMPEEGFRAAASPLFTAGEVEALEWSIDIPWGFGNYQVPAWADAVIDLYANAGCLYGHGVYFSALVGGVGTAARGVARAPRARARTTSLLPRDRALRPSSARGFLPSAPLPVPMSDGAIRVGREALGAAAGTSWAPPSGWRTWRPRWGGATPRYKATF